MECSFFKGLTSLLFNLSLILQMKKSRLGRLNVLHMDTQLLDFISGFLTLGLLIFTQYLSLIYL